MAAPRTTETIAASACCARASDQKGLKLAQPLQAKPATRPNPRCMGACEGDGGWNWHGLWSGIIGRTNALSSADAVGGRLRRTVRPDGQNGKPHFDDGRKLRKSTTPPRRRNACKMIAGCACYARASGQKGLKQANRPQAKPGETASKTLNNAWETKCRFEKHGLDKADFWRD